MSVSESVCLFVPYLLRKGKPQRAETLRYDSPWDAECFRLKNIQIRETASTKIACTVLSLALSKASECCRNHSGCTLFEFIKEPLHVLWQSH